jgi:capsular polysaccharide transport system permease protein
MRQKDQNATGRAGVDPLEITPRLDVMEPAPPLPGPKGIVARLIRGNGREDRGTDAPAVPGPDHQGPVRDDVMAPTTDLGHVRRSRISPRPTETQLAPAARSRTPQPARSGRSPGRRAKSPGHGRGFALCVVLPLAIIAFYMTAFARPQFTSTVAFTVRSMEHGSASDALSGFAQFAGGTSSTNALILTAFLESQTLVERLNARLDLVRHYAEPFDVDPVFALMPSATIEARRTHWRRMLDVRTDPGSGLVELRIRAFSPEMAQLVARELLVESRALLDELNADARASATDLARTELAVAHDRLVASRAALTAFRTENRILDPASDLEGRVSVLRLLQGQLAQALVAQDARSDASDEGPRVAALRERIDAERGRMIESDSETGQGYPERLAAHERLVAEKDYAEMAHRTALATLDMARAQAARQDHYLAVYIQPTLPERADHGRTAQIVGMSALFLVLLWSLGTLIAAAVRDRR